MTPEDRIARAMEFAEYGAVDGDHHKMWVIDQMVRALKGCPMVDKTKNDVRGNPFTFSTQGESEEYLAWVRDFESGTDGPHTYEWDCGIAP